MVEFSIMVAVWVFLMILFTMNNHLRHIAEKLELIYHLFRRSKKI